ncbi:MAG: hypothetical protein ACI9R3_004742, partial [Verrucomicrobiales bacterium]
DGEGPAEITALGETGAQDEFGTFLVTIDLRPYAIEVPGNQELVMSLVSEDSSAILRISHSRLEPAGVAEDVYQFDGTRDDQRPGFLSTNYQLPRIHYNGFLSMEVSGQSPLPQPATLQISRAENSAIRLHWASLVDHLYTLEAGTSLQPNGWSILANGLSGTGEEMEMEVEVPIDQMTGRFFKLSRINGK